MSLKYFGSLEGVAVNETLLFAVETDGTLNQPRTVQVGEYLYVVEYVISKKRILNLLSAARVQ